MTVYRIVKTEKRTRDLSGTGAWNEGGRWNNEGVFALYTSESEALAMLEVLVHIDESELPPQMFIMTIEIPNKSPFHEIKDSALPPDWRVPDNILMKEMGDEIFADRKAIGIKARSAVMPGSYNYILNPLFPRYYDLIKVTDVKPLEVNSRFLQLKSKLPPR